MNLPELPTDKHRFVPAWWLKAGHLLPMDALAVNCAGQWVASCMRGKIIAHWDSCHYCTALPIDFGQEGPSGSCLICGHIAPFAAWSGEVGVGVCAPCRNKAIEAINNRAAAPRSGAGEISNDKMNPHETPAPPEGYRLLTEEEKRKPLPMDAIVCCRRIGSTERWHAAHCAGLMAYAPEIYATRTPVQGMSDDREEMKSLYQSDEE